MSDSLQPAKTWFDIAVAAAWSVTLLTAVCFAQNEPEDASKIIQGTWKLTLIYRTPNVQGPSEIEQRKLLNTKLTYSVQQLKSCGQSVAITSLEEHRVTASDFLGANHVRFDQVRIDAPDIPEVIINERRSGSCLRVFPLPGQDVYIKGKNELLIDFEGVFYRASRVK
jgi:hypothetical protein